MLGKLPNARSPPIVTPPIIVSIEECRSAQQQVWILTLNKEVLLSSSVEGAAALVASTSGGDDIDGDDDDDCCCKDDIQLWRDCLQMGCNRLVVRVWKGGCTWWNLNRNSSPRSLAEQELMGYRWSHQALLRRDDDGDSGVIIPRVLYSQISSSIHPDTTNSVDSEEDIMKYLPWAIVEYVGPHSLYYTNKRYDSTWVESMVKMRHEFGFDEPHPRWGRVPESQALGYAAQVLDQFILPLHVLLGSSHPHATNNNKESLLSAHTTMSSSGSYHTYESMIKIYQQAYQDLMKALVAAHYEQQQEQQQQPDAVMSILHPQDSQRWDQVLALIQNAVYNVLPSNVAQKMIPILQSPFPSTVLVHLDLQPQNLLLASNGSNNGDEDDHGGDDPLSLKVSSVLDWEDAAIADPRFELLLLGRKVCASRDQAEQIWKRYAEAVCSAVGTNKSSTSDDDDLWLPPVTRLGPLAPWLQLETIHSLLTMLLQSMDLLNGGRNPWETSKDLWGKIEREMARWQLLLVSTSSTTTTNDEQDNTIAEESTTNYCSTPTKSHQHKAAAEEDLYLADLGIHPAKCYRSSMPPTTTQASRNSPIEHKI